MRRLVLLIGILSLSVHYSHDVVAQMSVASTNTSTDARRLYQTGLDLLEAGQLSQAATTFRQALQFDPEFADAYAALGRTYFKMREWQQASDNLKRAVVLNHKQRTAPQIKPAQPANFVATHTPLNLSLRRIDAEIVSPNETTAATITLRELLPLVSEPPLEIKPTPVARTE